MDSEEHVCPVCGQPVETVVRRHKTLGAWVPKWVPGPCRNPECEAYAPEGGERERQPEQREQRERLEQREQAERPEPPTSPTSPASPTPPATAPSTAPTTEKT